ncbi:phospholipase D family protein [Altericista sp. CCNU0014]|uniref:phospholipase D family protein n=1 Tax=Altericista sp. CCNU0014 TaxID=3082949 RepID=UPI00384B3D85
MPDFQVQLVITAPEPYGAALAHRMKCRMTLGVLTQLLSQAKRYVVIAAPFMQAGYGLSSGTLADALRAALQRGVNVDVVGTGQGLQTLDTTWFRQNAQGRLRLFQSKENMTDAKRLGSHAKFCVADGLSAYVGSANLTAPGLGRHLEMGLLVQGEVARQIEDFWIYALEIELFIPVP